MHYGGANHPAWLHRLDALLLATCRALYKLAGAEGLPDLEEADWHFIDELSQRGIADAERMGRNRQDR